jgi:Ca-activated chloride channel homolog
MRHVVMAFVLSVLMMAGLWGCGDEQPPPPKKTQPTTPQQSTPVTSQPTNEPESIPEPPKAWPYLTGDRQTGISDDLLARNFVLIFDGSGSMQEVECSAGLTKCEAAQKAVVEWSATVPSNANLGLVAFHANSQGLTIQDLETGDRTRFMQTVESIQPGGKTPLTESLKQAFLMLEEQAQKQLGYGEYTIVVVTDGIANDPNSLTRAVDWLLNYTPINIFTIGFCIGEEHSLNQKGQTIYRAADNPEQLRQGLREALAESEEFDMTEF